MPKVNYVKSARKKNPVAQVGEPYYWWKFRYGGKHYSTTPPRASQLTQSDKLSRAYAASEALEDLAESINDETDYDDLQMSLEEISSEVGDVASEYRESRENMPESLQDSDIGQQCEENADALESWQQEIDDAISSVDADDVDWRDEARDAISDVAGGCPL